MKRRGMSVSQARKVKLAAPVPRQARGDHTRHSTSHVVSSWLEGAMLPYRFLRSIGELLVEEVDMIDDHYEGANALGRVLLRYM